MRPTQPFALFGVSPDKLYPLDLAIDVSSASKLSPARCVATVTAVGPPGDAAAENNTATVTIDVVDENDF